MAIRIRSNNCGWGCTSGA